MKRLDLACYGMLASAFILAGLLVVAVQNRQSLLPEARGDMVLNRDTITMLTTQTRPDEEALIVLEAKTGTLLVYRVDLGKKRLDRAGRKDIAEWFKGAAAEAARAGAGGP